MSKSSTVTLRENPVEEVACAKAGGLTIHGETIVISTDQRIELVDLTNRIMEFAKNFNITERVKAMFRLEAFNALNHPNFRRLQNASVGSTSILSPNFGVAGNQTLATATSTAIVSNGEAYRVAQLVLRVSF